MKRSIGIAGICASVVGVLMAYASVFLQSSRFELPILMFVGAALYLIGSFTAVICFGYKRGTKLYWALAAMRLLFAGAVIFLILRGLQS